MPCKGAYGCGSAVDNYFFASWPSPEALHCQRVPASNGNTHWLVATWIARAIVDRTRPSSSVSKPAIVHPPGAASSASHAYFFCP